MSIKAEKSSYDQEDIKSGSSKMKDEDNHDDYEVHTKKDAPPRFSTIFETKSHPMLAEPIVEATRRRRRNGVFIPMPIFILLVIMFLLESLVLFAYTAIGLYNQLPDRFVPMGRSSTGVACDVAPLADHQAPINISPNFVVGGAGNQATVTETVTMMGHSTLSEQLSSLSTSLSTSSMTTSALTTSSAASATSSTPATIAVVTVTPGGGVVTSVVLVTASAESQSSLQRPTSFVTVFAGASTPSSSSSSSSSASVAARDHSDSTSSTSSTSSTLSTSSTTTQSPTSTTSTTATTPAPAGTHMPCIGGAGAVALDCLR